MASGSEPAAYDDQSAYDQGEYEQQPAYADQSAYDQGYDQGYYGQDDYYQQPAQEPKELLQSKRAVTISDVVRSMRESDAYNSTVLSILVSCTDFFLHVGVAAWMTENWWGDHQPYWSFIVLALVGNLFGIVVYIFRNVGEPPNPHALPIVSSGPSEFSQKLAEQPTECFMVLLFSIVSTEALCFLTSDRRAQRTFRILDVVRSSLEGVPLIFLQLAFLYRHGWASSTLVAASFLWTIGTLLLKVLRTIIIVLASPDDKPAERRFLANTRMEDYVLLPIYTAQWVVLFVMMLFLDYATFDKRFSHDWLTRQMLALSGFNTSIAASVSAVLSNSTLSNPSALAMLTSIAGVPTNDTTIISCTPEGYSVDPFGHFEQGSGIAEAYNALGLGLANAGSGNGNIVTCPLNVSTLVSRALLPDGVSNAAALAFATKYLSPEAASLVSEWAWLHQRLGSCFAAGVLFVLAGCLSGIALLVIYLKSRAHSDAFHTSLIYHNSFTSACIAALGMANGGWLNCISQTRLGYSIVRRDSALTHLLFYGFPVIGIAGATQAAFNCQHRDCTNVLWNGSGVEFYTAFVLLLTVPLVWWQMLSLLTATVAVRSARAEANGEKGTNELPSSKEELDLKYPPLLRDGMPRKTTETYFMLLLSILKWMLQCVLLLALFWNSPLAIRTIGGRPAYEWASSSFDSIEQFLNAPISLAGGNLTLVGDVDVAYFQNGVLFWVIGMLVNVAAVGLYMAFRSTPVLRKAVEEHLALTACAFTCSVVHPEAMCVLADRRSDVMMLRKLGALPALLLDIPICALVVHWLIQYGYNFFVLLVGCASLAHCLAYLSRAVVVLVTENLIREVDDTPAEGSEEFQRMTAGDMLAAFVSLFHIGLMFALLGLYYHGWQYGYFVGYTPEEIGACSTAFWATVVILSIFLCSSLCTSVSFLNHFSFSHRGVSESAYKSGIILVLSCLDVSWLSLLATDAISVREVKRAASFVSLGVLFFPMLVLQAVIVFLARVPVTLLDAPDLTKQPELGSGGVYFTDFDMLISGESSQNFAFGITVIVGIAKLMLMVTIQSNRKAEALRKGESMPTSPFVHTPWVLGYQWMENRKLDSKAAQAEARRRAALAAASGERKPTHHMGYALDDATGNYVFDEGGNPVLGNGVSCALDDHGNYMFDDQGGYVLQDEHGVIIGEGYGENGDGYGGWVSVEGGGDGRPEDVTNTSRSTDTQLGRLGGGDSEMGGSAPAEMIWATCLKRAVYMTPDGVQGVYVSLPQATSPLPYFFLQAHEVKPYKASSGFGRAAPKEPKVQFSYLSLDAAPHAKMYIEQHVSNDPQGAWERLQAAQAAQGDLAGTPGPPGGTPGPFGAGPGAQGFSDDLAVDTYDGDAYGDAYGAQPPYGGQQYGGGGGGYGGGYGGAGGYSGGCYGNGYDQQQPVYEDRALPVAQAPSAGALGSPDPAAQRL